MGKTGGFMEYDRLTGAVISEEERIKNFNEFHTMLSPEEQKKQAARCMDCGIPFCQAGKMIAGMASGCPLNNLVPEIKLPPYKITEYSSIYVGGDDLKDTYQIVFKNGTDEILKSKLDSLIRINSKWKKNGNEYAYDTIFWEDEVVDSIIVRPLEGTATFIKYKW